MSDQPQILDLENADQLMDWIRRDHDRWGNDPVDWVFRGQKENYRSGIIPSAWRADTFQLHGGKWIQATDLKANQDQCQSEYETIRRFFNMCDVQGLEIPGETPDLRKRIAEHQDVSKFVDAGIGSSGPAVWPPQELHWLIAIAQHYGVPTRFVDWTRKPLVATWFAAENAAKSYREIVDSGSTTDKRLVVWAINRRASFFESSTSNLWMTSAPRSLVPNLHLQSGKFTFTTTNISDFSRNFTRESLETTIKQIAISDNVDLNSVIRAATLPWSQAGKVLQLLRNQFIQGATVYAGYEGASRSFFEKRWRN